MRRGSEPSTNEAVVEQFIHGNAGSHSRLASIPITEKQHALVGYGYACYALRQSTGEIVRYVGWMGFSNTTTQHLNLLGDDRCYDVDKQPGVEEVIETVVCDQEPPEAV